MLPAPPGPKEYPLVNKRGLHVYLFIYFIQNEIVFSKCGFLLAIQTSLLKYGFIVHTQTMRFDNLNYHCIFKT